MWAGDSRAYLLRSGELTPLTRDHSVVENLIASGELRREDADDHPHANVITRAVGAEPELSLEERHYGLEEGDKVLLCSDGLTKELADSDIAVILAEHDCADAADLLIAKTLENGGRDNVTVAVVQFYEDDETTVTL